MFHEVFKAFANQVSSDTFRRQYITMETEKRMRNGVARGCPRRTKMLIEYQ